MRRHPLLLSCLVALLFCSAAVAAEKKKLKVLEGYITKCPENTIMFEEPTANGNSQKRIMYVGAETAITVDGNAATHGDLQPGMVVRITPKSKTVAKSVEAQSAKKK